MDLFLVNTRQAKSRNLLTLIVFFIAATGLLQSQILKDETPAGKYIGTIVNGNFFNGSSNTPSGIYETTIVEQFSSIVAENDHKMENIIPNAPSDINDISTYSINTGKLDRMIDFANTNGIAIKRGHALMWYSQAPGWLENDAQNWSRQEIYDFAEKFITKLITYRAGEIDEWDVFNEIISDNNDGFRKNTWYQNVEQDGKTIQDFLDHCFIVARQALTDELGATEGNKIKLYYNDYSIEGFNGDPNSKNGFMRNMVSGMVNRGVPIDAVGLQSHFVNPVSEDFTDDVSQTMDYVIDLGLICNITELDIRICNGGQPASAAELNAQKESYQRIAEMAYSKDGSTGMTLWGFTDASSWIPGFFNGCGHALIYDNNYDTKPSFDGLIDGLNGITVVDNGGCNGETEPQAPFLSEAHAIPGAIEFENYDKGGEGVAYNDNDTLNNGNSDYRTCDAVDVQDEESGQTVIGWMGESEWLEYTVNIANSGTYDFTISAAANQSQGGGGTASLELDGVNISGTFDINGTGSWTTYQDIALNDIALNAGTHILRFNVLSGSFNVNVMNIELNTLGINDYAFGENDNFKAFPLPFRNTLNISFDGIQETQNVNLFDLQGKKVFSQNYNDETVIKITPTKISTGIYFLQVNFKNNTTKMIKLIKE